LRLELFQLMLRHQLAAVQKAWGVPKEIEVRPRRSPLRKRRKF
jgi:hypothetical protein